jgi:hypothetical protein
MKSNVTLGVLGMALSLASAANAQDFAEQGTFMVSVDRAFGFTHAVRTVDPDAVNIDTTQTIDNIGFLGQGDVPSPFSGPRASFDYFVIDGLNIGGSLVFWSEKGDQEVDNGPNQDIVDDAGFLIAPRVGYAIMFSRYAGWWPRGGFSFFTRSSDIGADVSESGFAFNADLPFVFVPVEHAAIVVGPAFDVSLGATGDLAAGPFSGDYDVQYFDFGIYAGLGFWL